VDEEWQSGAKDNSKKDAARQKAEEAERKKREKEALLKAEEESLPSKPKATAKKAGTGAAKKKESIRPAGPGAIAAGGGIGGIPLDDEKKSGKNTPEETPEVHLAATGIDSMLEALELVNARTDKEALGAKVSSAYLSRYIPAHSHFCLTGWPD
jgi:beta-glucosidase-like glycosyl hydrolase